MNSKIIFSLILVVNLVQPTFQSSNGGVNCAACAVIFGLVEQTSVIYEENIVQSFERVCGYLPDEFQKPCKTLLEYLGPILIEIIEKNDTPDVICLKLGLCTEEKGRTCNLFPLKDSVKDRLQHYSKVEKLRNRVAHLAMPPVGANVCDLPGIKEICKWIDLIFNNHDPAVDLDGDRHSTMETLRGYAWRGKDCNDKQRNIHPGAKPQNDDRQVDSNCNGISGVNPISQNPYETELCDNTDQRGIVILGDSISAHFHIPKEWLTASELAGANFESLPYILENEFDWPAFSYGTGFMNSTDTLKRVLHGTTDSLYYRLWQRNRCNFRDYQNIAVNGAASKSMKDDIEKSLYRNQTGDFPVIVVYALVGNDVCNGHPDTFAHMTTAAEMKQNAMASLKFLDAALPFGSSVFLTGLADGRSLSNRIHPIGSDATLPFGSSVFLTGLADGRILYNSLSNRIHPIGSLRKDVTYSNFYDYFNCLEISPCLGWMNTNETIRDLTTKRANELSGALKDLADESGQSFKNIKVYFNDNPVIKVIQEWNEAGKDTYELLEPVDGFHANQIANAQTARVVWEELEQKWPQVLGKVNPNNAKIQTIFGDQGGYR